MSETEKTETRLQHPPYFVSFYLGDFVRIVIEEGKVRIEYFDEEYREWIRSTTMTLDELELLVKRIIEIGRILENIRREG